MKKLVGRLPVNRKYYVLGFNYIPLDAACYFCDNCGKLISNIVALKDEVNNLFRVGLDCASTMQCYQNNKAFNALQVKKEFARKARFVKWFKTDCKAYYTQPGYDIFLYDKEAFNEKGVLISHHDRWNVNYKYRMNKDYFYNEYAYLKLPEKSGVSL